MIKKYGNFMEVFIILNVIFVEKLNQQAVKINN